jgi:hypothetical protein
MRVTMNSRQVIAKYGYSASIAGIAAWTRFNGYMERDLIESFRHAANDLDQAHGPPIRDYNFNEDVIKAIRNRAYRQRRWSDRCPPP